MAAQIMIIGSGAAGLMAANGLAADAHNVTVVEARARTGGRIHTLEGKFTIPIELGAEFMHGRQPLTHSLIEASKNQVSLLSGNRYQVWDGVLQQGDFFDNEWDALTRALRKLKTDTDIASFLHSHFGQDQYSRLRKKVKRFVEGFDAAEMDRVSALALREEWEESDDQHQYHIKGGYSKLIHHLEEETKKRGVQFVFSSPVEEIQWSEGHANILTSTGEMLEAEKVIITVPLGVLQNGGIRFTPSLPHHITAFKQMGFGGVIKVFFEFKHPFWEQRVTRPFKDVAFIFSDAAIPTWWSQLPDKTPLLTGWLGGPSTRNISHNNENLFNKAIHSLQYIFECSESEITHEIREWHIADWVKDPFAMGAYAYPTVQARKAGEFVSQPVNNTLYFAGEAFYHGPAMGTVEAALVSGREVARKIMGERNE